MVILHKVYWTDSNFIMHYIIYGICMVYDDTKQRL